MDPIEAFLIGFVGWDLARSDRGPGQREERQDDVDLPQVVTQVYLTIQVAIQDKIWRRLADAQSHFALL